jgi:hypothetical protein
MARDRYADAPPRKGVSLAKGPVGLLGLASLALGVLGFIIANHSFAMHPMNGTVVGGKFLGIMGNGWTWVLFAAGGLLLLLGSPAHWGAKSMAFIVAIAYGAAAVIALVDGHDVFGIIAANHLTEIVLGAAAIVLLVLSMMPRVGGGPAVAPARTDRPARTGRFATNGDGDREAVGTRTRDSERA